MESKSPLRLLSGAATIAVGAMLLSALMFAANSSAPWAPNLAMRAGLAAPLLISMVGQVMIAGGAVLLLSAFPRPASRGAAHGLLATTLRGLVIALGVSSATILATAACQRPQNPWVLPPSVTPSADEAQG